MTVNVYDEFTTLRETILGDVNIGLLDTVDNRYRSQISDIFFETKEDLNTIQKTFEDMGIVVHRPVIKEEFSKEIITPYWKEQGIRNCLSPRDSFAVIGDTLLEGASHKRSSHFESLYYKDLFIDLFKKGSKWISIPQPSLTSKSYDNDEYISNYEPILDTAQLARYGDRILVSTRGAGNQLGAEWIRRTFSEYEVIYMDWCFNGHMDAQVKILKPGTIISPYAREKHPEFMQNWEIIPTSIYGIAPKIIDNRLQDDDFDNSYFQTCILNYNENTVFLYESYKKLFPDFIQDLEQRGINCVFLPFRHQTWFSQGLTCLTCDLVRDGAKTRYDF